MNISAHLQWSDTLKIYMTQLLLRCDMIHPICDAVWFSRIPWDALLDTPAERLAKDCPLTTAAVEDWKWESISDNVSLAMYCLHLNNSSRQGRPALGASHHDTLCCVSVFWWYNVIWYGEGGAGLCAAQWQQQWWQSDIRCSDRAGTAVWWEWWTMVNTVWRCMRQTTK